MGKKTRKQEEVTANTNSLLQKLSDREIEIDKILSEGTLLHINQTDYKERERGDFLSASLFKRVCVRKMTHQKLIAKVKRT